jgi:hypothetical protein
MSPSAAAVSRDEGIGMLPLALLLLQAPAQQPARGVARIEVSPAAAQLEVGQTLQLSARALDANGQPVPGAVVQWFADGSEGSVDSTGLVTAGYLGKVRVAVVAGMPGQGRPAFAEVTVRVMPRAASRIEVVPATERLVVGQRLTLTGTAFSADGDRRDDEVRFTSSSPRILEVTRDGRLVAKAAGVARITAAAGAARAERTIRVDANTIAMLDLAPAATTVRTGDVVRFTATPRTARGQAVTGLPVRWAVAATRGVAQVDEEGAFVAEAEGTYTVTATVGTQSADASIRVLARDVGRPFEVTGRLPIAFRSGEVWVHPSGSCAYLTTLADRVYAVDVRDPASPTIVDSMMVNARIINDVMTTEDGRYGVFSREGASDRKNGLIIFEATDPCHPKPIADYTETVTGGVHSSFVYQGRAYITDDATGSLRVIDIRDPYHPKETGRWQTTQSEAGRYIHDVEVKDGLAYLSYWNDGLIILDVGNGIRGGSPERPQFVSQLKYDLEKLYSRVDQLYGLAARGTHTAWRHRNYIFVGDEVYGADMPKGLRDGNDLTFGRLHVIDVSDITKPKEVAWYEPTDGGVHNVWVAGDTLYLGNYQGGARALDISGELKGDLLRQGREISWMLTADDAGDRPRAAFAWGAVVKDGSIYVPDINTGLWILRLAPKKTPAVP